MYILNFPRVPDDPQVEQVTGAEVRRISNRSEDRGYFDHHGSFAVPGGTLGQERLVVSFRPVIYIASELSEFEQAEIEAHELLHFDDFASKADHLKTNLRRVVRTMPWNELRAGWQWFLYDLKQAAYTLHRQLGRADARMPNQPSSPRPF